MARSRNLVLAAGIACALAAAHAAFWRPGEPYYNNDETRHLMTGVFFHDVYLDFPVTSPKQYTVEYYLQYPALGLLVWPPFFYMLEGAVMLAFGTSVTVGKVLVLLFGVAACIYLFRLASRTHGEATALLAAMLLGLSPLVFSLSRQVMLEAPSLAFSLAALFHWDRYLEGSRRRDVVLTALASALALITRFDGIFLPPLLLILMAARGRWDVARRKEVWASVLLAVAIIVPFHAPTAIEFGWAHVKGATQGTSQTSTHLLAAENFTFYPGRLPDQLGWFLLPAALVGLVLGVLPGRRAASWPYLALAIATYVTFSPMAELESRHAVYWAPAFALFGAEGIFAVGRAARARFAVPALAVLVLAGTLWAAGKSAGGSLRGYEEAARFVVENTKTSRFCLFDNLLNGDFIYHVRRLDPHRRLWVLRGDKLLYSALSDPRLGYKEFTLTDEEILDTIFRYDPEWIVVEEPQVYFSFPIAEKLRSLLRMRTDRFRLERSIPLETDVELFRGVRLDVYRSLVRNPAPETRVQFEMLGLQRQLGVDLPRDAR